MATDNHGNGIEVHVPGIALVKNLKDRHLASIGSLLMVVLLAMSAFLIWQHDVTAASQRADISQKVDKGTVEVQKGLAILAEQQRLQTCIQFLSLPEQQQQRIKIAKPRVCERN